MRDDVTPNQLPYLLTVKELAAFLGFTTITIYRMLRDGDLPAKKIGQKYIIMRDEILKAITPAALTPKQKRQ